MTPTGSALVAELPRVRRDTERARARTPTTLRSSGSQPPGWWEGADSPAVPREPQLRSSSAQLRVGPDTAPAGGWSAVPSSPSEEPFSLAPPPRLQPPSSKAPATSSVPSFRRFF
uniref:Uncharacterized protein n=1 Tax=Sus scrofa TaxID=9823 RepID=A0A8W4FA86_PIG